MQEVHKGDVPPAPVAVSDGTATAEVRLERPKADATASKTAAPDATDKRTSEALYHERAGCGLFWALGRFRPTNYMIVRPLQLCILAFEMPWRNYMTPQKPCAEGSCARGAAMPAATER